MLRAGGGVSVIMVLVFLWRVAAVAWWDRLRQIWLYTALRHQRDYVAPFRHRENASHLHAIDATHRPLTGRPARRPERLCGGLRLSI